MRRITCCVKNCIFQGTRRHRFPNSKRESRLMEWIKILREELPSNDPFHIYKTNRICDVHFTLDGFSPGTEQLKHSAIKTLFLSNTMDTDKMGDKETLQDMNWKNAVPGISGNYVI